MTEEDNSKIEMDPAATMNISPTVTQFSQNPYLNLRTKPNDPTSKTASGMFSFLQTATPSMRTDSRSAAILPDSKTPNA